MITFIYILASVLLCIYFVFIGIVLKGWNCTQNLFSDVPLSPFSLIIAIRNEACNLPLLFSAIDNLALLSISWELILVNDHSEDGSFEQCLSYARTKYNVQVHSLDRCVTGKKAAVALALSHAQYPIIVQTDADCTFHPNWLQILLKPFSNGADVIFGPVKFKSESSILTRLFSLEFLSLVVSGAGLAGSRRPVFCNAANFAYRRHLLATTSMNFDTPSGDDVFVMHEAKRMNKKIVFVKDSNATVTTNAPVNLSAFISQRVRWASKAKRYTDIDSLVLSFFIAGYNIFILFSFFYIALSHENYQPFLIVFVGKFSADIFLFWRTLPFFRERKLLFYAPLLSLFYPFYVASVGIYSIFANYEWKGRILKG